MIDAYMVAWKLHLKETNKTEYNDTSKFADDVEYSDYLEYVSEFAHNYVKTVIPGTDDQDAIITDYGFKKLIDEMCELNGDEVCELDLLHFSKNKAFWVQIALTHLLEHK